jgi:hypothetical protein
LSTGLRRFWYPLAGYLGVGVTALTETDARALAEAARARSWPKAPPVNEVICDVDIQNLDQKHVVPNMEAPNWAGVWYPRGFAKSNA